MSSPLDTLQPPRAVRQIAKAVRAHGGRACLVGGSVRDQLLGQPVKDWDIEVFGLAAEQLEAALRNVGRVNTVGRSFAVFKVRKGGHELDVSLPRRDVKTGPGHRGITVEGDPDMSPREAARRRDLTINAILVDLYTHEVLDPWNGVGDLRDGILREVDPHTFLEDPLRALRVVQFAARLPCNPTPSLIALCRQAPLDELPAERIRGEWMKLMLKGTPSRGLRVAQEAQILPRLFPEILAGPTPHDALDNAVAYRDRVADPGRRWAYMLAVWLLAARRDDVVATLDHLNVHRQDGYPVRDKVLAAWDARLAPIDTHAELRHLSTRTELELTLLSRRAWCPRFGANDLIDSAVDAACSLDIQHAAPTPMLRGRDLRNLGVQPGREMGRLVQDAYRAQLDGSVTSLEEAIAHVARILADAD